MKAGILIIGSLWWGLEDGRPVWRKTRLASDRAMPVHVKIQYARISKKRGKTFTMTFGGSLGRALVVPCIASCNNIDDLRTDAEALWRAEYDGADPGKLSIDWGGVGVCFRDQSQSAELSSLWSKEFHDRKHHHFSPVDKDGILQIEWPQRVDGQPLDLDVLLATATKPESPLPSTTDVAQAWANQSVGFEEYFFSNRRHGICTANDEAIWRHLVQKRPEWECRYHDAHQGTRHAMP